jgi:catechol 2,3-dioxygenase-like lactoylglutathione lyase family enzyme
MAPKVKFRHIAISTEDPEKTAAWYKEVFGLVEVGKSPSGVYLSDGDLNFAVLRIKDKKTGEVQVGLSHFGFGTDDAEGLYKVLEDKGVERLPDIAIGNQYYESKFKGPDGLTLDVSEHGWVGTTPVVSEEPVSA